MDILSRRSFLTRSAVATVAATGYQPYWDDQAYPRHGKLAASSNLVMDDTAGCIASTPADMARYLRTILNRGQGTNKRIVSDESFTLFSTPYIKAEEFSPTASYGYGIAIDTLDGHKMLRHTGGMVSFASSIHVDLDGGVAAFASINAMQGYRPTAVTEYAARLLRAQRESKPLPDPQPIADPTEVENAADYAGTFSSADGRRLIFKAEDKHLSLVSPDTPQPHLLQHAGGDSFLSTVEGSFTQHAFEFGRKDSHEENSSGDKESADSKPKPPVVEVSYGPDWYANQAYGGPKTFHAPEEYAAYTGHYRSDSPWGGDTRVFVQKDKLIIGGSPVTAIGNGLFRTGEEPWSPDTAEFHHIVEGKARLMKLSGIDYWRVEVD